MQQTLAFFRGTFDAAPVGMLIIDGGHRILEVNREIERLFGGPREELLGRSLDELVTPGPTGPLELFAHHKAGRPVPVQLTLTPLPAGDGTSSLATLIDLTERQGAEDRFRLAIEAAPNGMLMVDSKGTITLVNRQIELLFGYTRDELLGRSVEELVPLRFRGGHANLRANFGAHPVARPMGADRELFALRKDGREFPVEIGLSPLRTSTGVFILSSIVDITERTEARLQLQSSLRDKEILLRELHHRAKNNLQLISSLLSLAEESPKPDVISETRDRIHSIALVHEKLYQSGTLARIELQDYLSSLAEQVAHAWTTAPVKMRVEADSLSLPLDMAIPCGLVVNELVTNAYKHAFPAGRAGTIVVAARREGARLNLTVTDDGVGMPPGPLPRGHIGLELVHALARQLRGTVVFTSTGAGTRAALSFEGLPS